MIVETEQKHKIFGALSEFIIISNVRTINSYSLETTTYFQFSMTKLCSIEQSATTTQPILLVLQNKSERISKYKNQPKTAT